MTSASRHRRLRALVVTALGWLALSSTAFAQTDEARSEDASHTRTAARTLAAQGTEAFERHDYAAALDLFQRAGALVEAPTLLLMQARTLVELGRWVEAADRYSSVLSPKFADDTNPAFQAAAQAATEEYEALRARLPLLRVELQGERPAVVWIDGRELPRPLVGVDTPLDPGLHRVEVREAGRAPIVRDVRLAEGAREELLIILREEPPEPTFAREPAPLAAAPLAPASGGAEHDATLGWVTLGVGAGATLVGVGTGLYALKQKSELDAACNPGCPPSLEDDIHDFRRFRTVSYVAFGLGAFGLAWGGYTLLSGPSQSTALALRAGTRGAWVEGSF